jgi:hypothetical protein
MPRVSDRAKKLKQLRYSFKNRAKFWLLRECFSDPEDSDEDIIDCAVAEAYISLRSKRFIYRNPSYKTRGLHVLDSYLDLPEVDFLLHFRMHRESFWKLYQYIQHHAVFNRVLGAHGEMYKPQIPVRYQLALFLYMLGANGSDANVKKMKTRFNISAGTIINSCDRCTIAILSTLQSDVVSWPDADERREISSRIKSKYGFPNCIGFLDGTLFPLAFKPTLYGEDYHTRKGFYGVHCLMICDDTTRVLDFVVGWPGSVHDNRVWSNSDWYENPNKYFSFLQYLLADSAFAASDHVIPAYKKSRGVHKLPEDRELFNTLLATARIKVEHCIGLLKNRFPCLRDIRVLLKGKASMKKIIDRIMVCIVLHNLLVGSPYPQSWEDLNDEEEYDDEFAEDNDECIVPVGPIVSSGNRREQIYRYMLE